MAARPEPARLRTVREPGGVLKLKVALARPPEEPPISRVLVFSVLLMLPSLIAWMTVPSGESEVMVVARIVLVGDRMSDVPSVPVPPEFTDSPTRKVPVPRLA